MGKDFGIQIEHVGLHVPNMQETIDWYHEILGFELVIPSVPDRHQLTGGVFPKCCTMRLGNFTIEIYEVMEGQPFDLVDFEYKHGVKHMSFEIDDIFGWIEFIKEKGVEIVVENYYGTNGVTFYVRDNSGILLECTDVREKLPFWKDKVKAEQD